MKLLEGDEEIKASAQLSEAQRGRIRAAIAAYVERGREKHPGIDSLTLMVDARYAAIEKALNESGFPRQREHETTVPTRSTACSPTAYSPSPSFLPCWR